jgi:hypothetical protein
MNLMRDAMRIDSWEKLQHALAILTAVGLMLALIPIRVFACAGGTMRISRT